mgnify:CR=1 FL=1
MPQISGRTFGDHIDQREVDRTRDLRHAQTQLNFLRGLNQMDNLREFEEEMPAELAYYTRKECTTTTKEVSNCYFIHQSEPYVPKKLFSRHYNPPFFRMN